MFIFGCSGSELRHAGSLLGHVGLPSSGGTRPSSCCEWSSSPHGAGALRSRTRGGTCVPCMGRQTLTPGPPGKGSTCLCRCRKRADRGGAGAKGETHRNVQVAGRVCGASGKEVRAGKENWGVVYTHLSGWCREVTESSRVASGEPSCGEAR